MFQKRTALPAEEAEADDTPDDEPDEPVAVGSAVSPALVELGEAHFWPHARAAGDLTQRPPAASSSRTLRPA